MRSANSPSEILRFAIMSANFTTTAIIFNFRFVCEFCFINLQLQKYNKYP